MRQQEGWGVEARRRKGMKAWMKGGREEEESRNENGRKSGEIIMILCHDRINLMTYF